MDWNCTLTEERLSDYLEGQLGQAESSALESHKRNCSLCSELVQRVGALVGEMHRLDPVEEPANLRARIIEATLGRRPSAKGWRRWFGWTPAVWQPRFAIGVATVAACAAIVVQAGGVMPNKLHKANLSPTSVVRSVTRQAHLKYADGVKFVNSLRVVYEIESRLQPQNPPQENPAPPERNELQPDRKNPEEKSDTRPGRSHARSDVFFAGAATPGTLAGGGAPLQPQANRNQPILETHTDRNCGRTRDSQDVFASCEPSLEQGSIQSAAQDLMAEGRPKPEWSAP